MGIYTTEPSIQSLVEEYKSLDGSVAMGTRARVQQCVYLAKIKDALIAEHGGEQTKAYKQSVGDTIVSPLKLSKVNYRKMSQIGRFVAEKNDERWYDMTLDAIQKEMRRSETIVSDGKPAPKVKVERVDWERKYADLKKGYDMLLDALKTDRTELRSLKKLLAEYERV